MVQEVIDSIIEAEKAAEGIIAQAEKEADAVVIRAEADAERLRAEAQDMRKAKTVERDRKANADGDAKAAEVLKQGKGNADKEAVGYDKKVNAAIDFIVREMV